MTICYINGKYEHLQKSSISVTDRGFNFAEGIYEVILAAHGKLIDFEAHYNRLIQNSNLLGYPFPMSQKVCRILIEELLKKNDLTHEDASVYIQTTRGIDSSRSHLPLKSDLKPTIFILTQHYKIQEKLSVTMTQTDPRSRNNSYKRIALFYNCEAIEQAKKIGKNDVWFIDDFSYVTEAAKANAWIVTHNNILVTRNDSTVLPGVTKERIISIAKKNGLEVDLRPFSVDEAKDAKELFTTASLSLITPLIALDDVKKDKGEITTFLRQTYIDWVRSF